MPQALGCGVSMLLHNRTITTARGLSGLSPHHHVAGRCALITHGHSIFDTGGEFRRLTTSGLGLTGAYRLSAVTMYSFKLKK